MVFPVVMYGCESWNVKRAECRRIDSFELWFLGRLLSPLETRGLKTARRSNPSILNEIGTEYSLEGLLLMMKLHLLKMKRHLMQRTDSLEKTVMLGKIEGRRRKR